MENLSNFFALPMSPARSWMLIGLIFLISLTLTYFIAYIDQTVTIAMNNVPIGGLRGFGHAFLGNWLDKIYRKQVLMLQEHDDGYCAKIGDTENVWRYFIVPVKTDEYQEITDKDGMIIRFGGRVENCTWLHDNNTDEDFAVVVMSVYYNTFKEVEEAMNNFFDDEYAVRCAEAGGRDYVVDSSY